MLDQRELRSLILEYKKFNRYRKCARAARFTSGRQKRRYLLYGFFCDAYIDRKITEVNVYR